MKKINISNAVAAVIEALDEGLIDKDKRTELAAACLRTATTDDSQGTNLSAEMKPKTVQSSVRDMVAAIKSAAYVVERLPGIDKKLLAEATLRAIEINTGLDLTVLKALVR
ncbi:MAG: hypothetical protein G8237_09645 [Magnetococcales bacterium]|nr:hypothetical protein [Magnetococcales bacterium]NGZ06608.1 hypothetical protein [Magnetococcales bacterium]